MLSRLVFLGLCVSQFFPAALPCRAEAAAKAGLTVETGDIAGAKFTLARPAPWNQRVLLLAHGYRDPNLPLAADLFPEQLAYRTLLDEGWIVAATSYRRNGIIVADALADLDALRAHIEKKFGAPDRVLLEGESMGGLVVTLMAERDRGLYSGAIAIGAALEVKEDNTPIGLNLQPQIPLLFLSNQTELEGPISYLTTKLRRADYPTQLRPALFRVSRDGHVNVNQHERLAALRALNLWLDSGRAALPQPASGAPFFDTTVAPEPQPSRVVMHVDGHGFDALVIEVAANYGNVALNAQPADFAAAGIAKMTWFQLTAHRQTYRVRYGRDFDSVKRGEWVAFPGADGFFWLSRNYADAAATAALKIGDPVTIRRYDEE